MSQNLLNLLRSQGGTIYINHPAIGMGENGFVFAGLELMKTVANGNAQDLMNLFHNAIQRNVSDYTRENSGQEFNPDTGKEYRISGNGRGQSNRSWNSAEFEGPVREANDSNNNNFNTEEIVFDLRADGERSRIFPVAGETIARV